MSRLLNKIFYVLLCATFTSCGFIDLRPIKVDIYPDIKDFVLPDSYSPVILKFDTKMVKNDAEGILQITSYAGSVRGDLSWNGNDLYFVPIGGWTAGTRYAMSFFGTIRSVDGRDLRIEHFNSFYAINRNSPPLLESHYPADGASVGTNGVFLEFNFSCPMDRLTTESALSIEGIANKIFEWSCDDTILKIAADKPLSPWLSYRWNLKDTAKSADGVPIAKAYSGTFKTDLDQILPRVTGVFPAEYSNGCWLATGADIETKLKSGQGIAVEFNKPMGESVLRSLRFEPSLAGKTELLSENSIVYIFTKDPEPQTEYTLIVSADTKDSEGLKIGEDYRISFTPDIPYLKVLSFTAREDSEDRLDTKNNQTLQVQVEEGTGYLFFFIGFSLPFNTEEKINTVQRITLTSLFPRTLSPVALQSVNWISEDRLYMRWENLEAGNDNVPHFYKLTIPGGKGGVSAESGIYMKEDLIIYLEAVNEI